MARMPHAATVYRFKCARCRRSVLEAFFAEPYTWAEIQPADLQPGEVVHEVPSGERCDECVQADAVLWAAAEMFR